MSTPTITQPLPMPSGRARASTRSMTAPRPELVVLLLLAGALNLWALSRNGFANEYYSAAVRSMSTDWHAFLYGSFDVSGVMTVDKPPLALWVQALSARIFGFGSLSMLVPQALMGVASVGLTYDLTRRTFGRGAGFIAGLVLALTPMAVAMSRHNNPDALLVLCSVAALWCLVRALHDGRTRWIVAAGVCVGLGFEAKMGVALMVVPGIMAAWLWIAPRGRLAALRQLLAGGAAMIVVGGAWPMLMALTPAADRPWISGTGDNSIWSLIFGYNGLGRLVGQGGGPGGGGGGAGPGAAGPGGGGGAGGPGGGLFGGETGPFRLLNEALGGQAGWMLGFAVVAGVAILVLTRLRRADARTGWLLAVGGAFLVTAVAFSKAQGIFHPYYVSLLAPFTAALVGAGAGEMIKGGTTMRILGPLAIAGGVATELVVLGDNPDELQWLVPVLVAAGAVTAVALATGAGARVRTAAVAVAIGFLLLAPATWAVQTLGHATSGTFPAGGPASSGIGGPGGMGGGPGGAGGGPGGAGGPGAGIGGPPGAGAPPAMPGGAGVAGTLPPAGAARSGGGAGGMFGGDDQSLSAAIAYARQHGGGTVAVSSQNGAAGSLITSGAKVVAIGGFSGRESQVSVSWLADAIDAGKIRWVLTDGVGGGMPQDSRVGSTEVMAAVAGTCTAVSSVDGLYDCAGNAGALRALAS